MPLLSLSLTAALAVAAQAGPAPSQAFDETLVLGAGRAAVEQALEPRCDSLQAVSPPTAGFPLAREEETHLVCTGFTFDSGARLDAAVFTLADGALVQIEARGDTAPLTEHAGDSVTFQDWTAYPAAGLMLDSAAGTAHILSADGLHTNLFAWHNPLLDGEPLDYPPLDVSIPPEVRPGASLETLMPEIEAACPVVQVREIDPPSLPTEPATQTQINCFGYPVAGFERKIEFVFGDDQLVLAWILTGRGESGRLQAAMDAAYGTPVYAGDTFRFYEEGRIALRFDRPEILVVEQSLGASYIDQLNGAETAD